MTLLYYTGHILSMSMDPRRAGLNTFAGRSWPAGRTLPITGVDPLQNNTDCDTDYPQYPGMHKNYFISVLITNNSNFIFLFKATFLPPY